MDAVVVVAGGRVKPIPWKLFIFSTSTIASSYFSPLSVGVSVFRVRWVSIAASLLCPLNFSGACILYFLVPFGFPFPPPKDFETPGYALKRVSHAFPDYTHSTRDTRYKLGDLRSTR